jgi:hypothetical protein
MKLSELEDADKILTREYLENALGRLENKLDARFNAIDAKFTAIDAKFNAVDGRFNSQRTLLILAIITGVVQALRIGIMPCF